MGPVLLDTHAMLWILTEPAKLSANARRIVEDRNTVLLASAATAWEIATKHRLGKLPTAGAVMSGYERHLERAAIDSLVISPAHALTAGSLEWQHRDPFDRMLAATAIIEAIPLMTADPAFDTLNGLRLIW
ncbi:type II toxin-antitoxin system VapC family toxin [Propionibacteriaceae bacterium Y2011]